MASGLFYEEDEVSMFTESGGLRYGLVTESSEYFSSDDEDENDACVYERLRKGTVRVSWHPDGHSDVLPESELKLADRSLMPGDIVRRFIKGEDSQRGCVTTTRISCHLQVIGKPHVICDVDSRNLLSSPPFSTQSGDVYLDSWVGKVVNALERVTIKFSDGATCEVTDEESVAMLSDFTDIFDKQQKHTAFSPMVFYEGQVLKGDMGGLAVNWVKSTKRYNDKCARKLRNHDIFVTVEKVETYQIEVNWICQGFSFPQDVTPTAIQPPPRVIKGENLQRIKKLDCFEACNYKIGERAMYDLKDTDKIIALNSKTHHSVMHQLFESRGFDPKTSSDSLKNTAPPSDNKELSAEANSSCVGLDSKDCKDEKEEEEGEEVEEGAEAGANAMETEDAGNSEPCIGACSGASITETNALQPKQSNDKKAKSGMKKPVAQIRQLKKKKLKPSKRNLQTPVPDLSLPKPGQRLPVEVIHTSTVVDVVWQDGTKELDIISTDLLPVHHLDELEFFPGDYVLPDAEIQTFDVYGVVQSVDHRGRTCRVKWLRHSSLSSADTVVKVDEVSVYDIKDHPDLKFRAGHVVVRVCSENAESMDAVTSENGVQQTAGQVYELGSEGPLLIQWHDGSQSQCYPLQLYLVSDEMSDLYSDSDDSYSSDASSSSSSDESWGWETEEEMQLPMEDDSAVINKTVESSNSTCLTEMMNVVDNLRESTKRIEDLVTNVLTKGLTTVSWKILRQVAHFFRLCHDFDIAAGTCFFDDKELVSAVAELKRLCKKHKAQHPSKQAAEIQDMSEKAVQTDQHKQKDGQRTAAPAQEESGNDSGLEKSPSASELREMDQNDVSHSSDDCSAFPSADDIDVLACSESTSAGVDSIKSVEDRNGVAVVVDICRYDFPSGNESAKSLASSGVVFASLSAMLSKLCELVERLSKVWPASDSEDDKLGLSAIRTLDQVLSSKTKNLSFDIKSLDSKPCDESNAGSVALDITDKNHDTVEVQNDVLLDSVVAESELNEKSTSAEATTDGTNKDLAVGNEKKLSLTLNEIPQETAAEEVESTLKTPATPAEIRAKVEFNPDGFALVDWEPDFHHYKDQRQTPVDSKTFYSTIRREMKLLQSCLPNGIYVKGFESRMDLFSVMIEGPDRTPYEDGLFFFDVQLPNNYPSSPPLFFYISYCADRLNPNLYEDGKVCVSLLGTWTGKGTEMWSSKSNLLQVLISIQGLILNPEPYYNEAGYERQKGTQVGYENSRMYNEMAILKMIQSMTKIAVNPFRPFSSEVQSHLKQKGFRLLNRLRNWLSVDGRCSNGQTGGESDCAVGADSGVSTTSSNEAQLGAGANDMFSSPVQTSDVDEGKCNSEDVSHASSRSPNEISPTTLDGVTKLDRQSSTEADCRDPKASRTCCTQCPTNGVIEPCGSSSFEAFCQLKSDVDSNLSPPTFPLFPLSKGFRLSLSKCLESFESVLNSIGIEQ